MKHEVQKHTLGRRRRSPPGDMEFVLSWSVRISL